MTKKIHEQFQEFLEKNDSRYSTQKKTILTEVLKTKKHFEIEEFLLTLYKKNQKIGRATVYRTVKQLLEAGLIQKISTKDGKVYYESSPDQVHLDHIICNDCGKITEVKDPKIETLIKTHCEKLGFIPTYRSLHIYADCKDEKCNH